MLSVKEAERISVSSMSSVKDSNLGGGSARNSLSVDEAAIISQSKSESALTDTKQPVYIDEISSNVGDDSSRKDEGLLESCGILPSNCLPCLNSTVPSIEKRRSLSSSPPGTRKKAALKLSFKWREGHATGPLRKLSTFVASPWHLILKKKLTFVSLFNVSVSTKMQLQRPVAGTQVPFCPLEKKMLDCWSIIEPSSFRVRSKTYFR